MNLALTQDLFYFSIAKDNNLTNKHQMLHMIYLIFHMQFKAQHVVYVIFHFTCERISSQTWTLSKNI